MRERLDVLRHILPSGERIAHFLVGRGHGAERAAPQSGSYGSRLPSQIANVTGDQPHRPDQPQRQEHRKQEKRGAQYHARRNDPAPRRLQVLTERHTGRPTLTTPTI